MNYEKLIRNLKNGREIEFTYKNMNYSISNFDSVWYFSSYNENIQKTQELSGFYDINKLIKEIEKIRIYGKSLKNIFDNREYDKDSLTLY